MRGKSHVVPVVWGSDSSQEEAYGQTLALLSDPDDIADNVASIAAIPEEELPDPQARATLLALATAGVEIYAYVNRIEAAVRDGRTYFQPAADGPRVIWMRPVEEGTNSRMSCAQWQRIAQQDGSAAAVGALLPAVRLAQHRHLAAALGDEVVAEAEAQRRYDAWYELGLRVSLACWKQVIAASGSPAATPYNHARVNA